MSVKIGHASIDERGMAHGGAAGDQTGREVCIRDWWFDNWKYVLRPKDPAKAEAMARTCEAGCANNHIGYDQFQRLSLYAEAKAVGFDLSRITTNCECDCSAFMNVCCIANGINVGTTPRTSNMLAAYQATGAFTVFTASTYVTSQTYLKRGDILLSPSNHTAMVLSDGAGIVSPYKAFVFGVQRAIGVTSDGVAGPKTLAATPTISATKNRSNPCVKHVQTYLNSIGYSCGTADGVAGAKFTSAVKRYQADHGCVADGEITAKGKTWQKLLGLL